MSVLEDNINAIWQFSLFRNQDTVWQIHIKKDLESLEYI